MVIYIIYFGCITLVLILKPRNGTQPQMPWKACQSSLCPCPEEMMTVSAPSKGRPLSVLSPPSVPVHGCSLPSWPCSVPLHLQSPPSGAASAQPALGWYSRAHVVSSVGSCFLVSMGLCCHFCLPTCETFCVGTSGN